jgi:hypothetical protein
LKPATSLAKKPIEPSPRSTPRAKTKESDNTKGLAKATEDLAEIVKQLQEMNAKYDK